MWSDPIEPRSSLFNIIMDPVLALAALRNRLGYRMRALLSDVVRGKVPVRSIGDRIDKTRIGTVPPEPLSPARPAFANRQPKHLDVFHTTFPDPAPRRPDLRVAVVLDTFSQSAFSYEFESAVITPENWEAELPADAIRIARSKDETNEHLEVLLSSGEARSRMADAGLRWINSGNSYSHRINDVLARVGRA